MGSHAGVRVGASPTPHTDSDGGIVLHGDHDNNHIRKQVCTRKLALEAGREGHGPLHVCVTSDDGYGLQRTMASPHGSRGKQGGRVAVLSVLHGLGCCCCLFKVSRKERGVL